MTDPIEGIEPQAVTRWLQDRTEVELPLRFTKIPGGHSNLTFRVEDQHQRRWVLRRPPLGQVLATAHDMEREHRIIASLAATDVPVPPTVGLCLDETVMGSHFYVMDFVDGTVIRERRAATALSVPTRQRITENLIDVLGRIHAVDVDAVGLGDLGRREGYIERQLHRWYGQWQQSKTRDIPLIDEVYERLVNDIPEQGPATIVHGDYRLDNCLVDDDGQIAAVLDWEICTLGDPLADIGFLLVYWGDPANADLPVPTPLTDIEGFGGPEHIARLYADETGRDVSQIDFYIAFGYWKLACIIEGVYARYIGGAMGGADNDAVRQFAMHVELLAEAAAQAVGRVE